MTLKVVRATAPEAIETPDRTPAMQISDATLVRGALAGDRAAFAELYDRRARVVRAICWDETRDVAAAADLAQESFLRAWRSLGRLRDPERFAAWIVGIARQVCREWKRGRFRRLRLVDATPEDATPTAELHADRSEPDERLARLRDAVARLPDAEKLALHAFYLQEMDAEQARGLCGLSRSGLYRVLSRARARLRRMLGLQEVLR